MQQQVDIPFRTGVEAHAAWARSMALELPDALPSVEEQVRHHLARELHDRVVQALQLMLVEMEQFKVGQRADSGVRAEVTGYQTSTRHVLTSLRELLYELRDQPTMESGFVESVQGLVGRFQAMTGIAADLSVSRSWPPRLRAAAAHHVERIVEEALANIRRHSGAHRVRVGLAMARASHLAVVIRDDGVGLPLADLKTGIGMGLTGMRERVLLLGGDLAVETHDHGGTIVRAVFPKENLL